MSSNYLKGSLITSNNIEIKNIEKKTSTKETILNIDSRSRNTYKYPNIYNFTMDFPRTFNNVSQIEISSLELPNTISVFDSKNNKIRWKNQWGYGFIKKVSIHTKDPATNALPNVPTILTPNPSPPADTTTYASIVRSERYIRIEVDGAVDNEIKKGDVVKIVGLYLNDSSIDTSRLGTGSSRADHTNETVSGPETHLIGQNSRHCISGLSHTGTILTKESNHNDSEKWSNIVYSEGDSSTHKRLQSNYNGRFLILPDHYYQINGLEQVKYLDPSNTTDFHDLKSSGKRDDASLHYTTHYGLQSLHYDSQDNTATPTFKQYTTLNMQKTLPEHNYSILQEISSEVSENYYTGWKMVMVDGICKGQVRKVVYSKSKNLNNVRIVDSFSPTIFDTGVQGGGLVDIEVPFIIPTNDLNNPSWDRQILQDEGTNNTKTGYNEIGGVKPGDKYQLIKDSYVVYKGPGDSVSTSVDSTGVVPNNVFYIIDYATPFSEASTATIHGDPHGVVFDSCVGMWYHDRDEYGNYNSIRTDEESTRYDDLPAISNANSKYNTAKIHETSFSKHTLVNGKVASTAENIINFATIGSRAVWFSDSSKTFSKILTTSFSERRYKNKEKPYFKVDINDNTEMITICQKYHLQIQKWLSYWLWDSTQLGGGFLFSVVGQDRISGLLPSHGLQFGNILSIIRYPPKGDYFNNWASTTYSNKESAENLSIRGFPISDLKKEFFGCAMIITDKSIEDWGSKNRFENDMEINLSEITDSRLNGNYRIVHVPKVPLQIGGTNNKPCYGFVLPIYVEEEILLNYVNSSSGNKFINWNSTTKEFTQKDSNNFHHNAVNSTSLSVGKWAMNIEVINSIGTTGIALDEINRKHPIEDNGLVKAAGGERGYEIDKSNYYDRDLFVIKLNPSASGSAEGIGGLKMNYLLERPFKFLFKDYIDDLGPILGLTDVNDRQDTSKWMRSISNTHDLTTFTGVKNPISIVGDSYFYISLDNLGEKGIYKNEAAVFDNKFNNGHILTKVLITMGSGEILFNTQIGGEKGGKSAIMNFENPIRKLDKLSISLLRKLSNYESFKDLEKYIRKTSEVTMKLKLLKDSSGKSVKEIAEGIEETIIHIRNKNSPYRANLLVGDTESNNIKNETWQFKVIKYENDPDEDGYIFILKILPQREFLASRESNINNPIDPIDIANFIANNVPQTSDPMPSQNNISSGVDYTYIKLIKEVDSIQQTNNPPNGFDYLSLNNVNYSLSLAITEEIYNNN